MYYCKSELKVVAYLSSLKKGTRNYVEIKIRINSYFIYISIFSSLTVFTIVITNANNKPPYLEIEQKKTKYLATELSSIIVWDLAVEKIGVFKFS